MLFSLQYSKKSFLPFKNRVTSRDILIFTQKLTTLTRAQIELLTSLKILYEQTESPILRDIILKIYNTTKEGETFSHALKPYPELFSSLYINIIRSGEATGRLDIALTQITEFLQRESTLRTKITVVAKKWPVKL